MSDIHLLARARQSFEQHAWAESYRLFEAADREAPLEPEDLERFATTAYLMGREDDSEALEVLFGRAEGQSWGQLGHREGAHDARRTNTSEDQTNVRRWETKSNPARVISSRIFVSGWTNVRKPLLRRRSAFSSRMPALTYQRSLG
jgi:hypothetical protein